MIFVGGVHGVGKTSFCKRICERYDISSYTASQLISRTTEPLSNKKVEDVAGNQNVLLNALQELRVGNTWFILDGHFCLLTHDGTVARIPEPTFVELHPRAIIVLVDSEERIQGRLLARDGYTTDSVTIREFQEEEVRYSRHISRMLNVPYLEHSITDPPNDVYELVKNLAFRQ